MMGTLMTLYKKWHDECERGKERELGSREEPSDGREGGGAPRTGRLAQSPQPDGSITGIRARTRGRLQMLWGAD